MTNKPTKNKKNIYTVCTLKIGPVKISKGINKGKTKLNFTRKCTNGFFFEKEVAVQSVLENWFDMYEESYYNYAVVEEYGPGIYSHPTEELWYEVKQVSSRPCKYRVTKIDKPECLRNIFGFGL